MASRAPKGTIFLPTYNTILRSTLQQRLIDGSEAERLEPMDLRIADTDEVRFRVLCNNEEHPNALFVSMRLPAFGTLKGNGVEEVLSEVYGSLVCTDALPDAEVADVCLKIDLSAEMPFGGAAEVVERVSHLKRHVMGAPLTRAFRALNDKSMAAPGVATVNYRRTESFWVAPSRAGVSVTYGIGMKEKTDAAMARVFAQEFVEAQRHVNNAPSVIFGAEPPPELGGIDPPRPDGFVGFITFTVQPAQVAGKSLDTVVAMLVGFRTYLDYHIKAAKTYLHMRMRTRVTKLLQVLNRAVPPEFEPKEMKLASGKTFKRKA